MLPKINRLSKREDFQKVYAKGTYASVGAVAVKFISSGQKYPARIGFSVGKNISKKAVERNRTRRVLREAIRVHVKSLKTGADIIVMVKPKYINADSKLTVKDAAVSLQKIFEKNNLFI